MNIEYRINSGISTDQFIDLLYRSSLHERRPVDDPECMEEMVNNSNLLVSAWDDQKLVGIARSMTDFYYACHLSDLAVDNAYQGNGIGRKLQAVTQDQLGPKCNLILVSAPAANTYYEHIGYKNTTRCWVLGREKSINK
jgi:ribosomal protein S18 acetylase RimI-like enzyme